MITCGLKYITGNCYFAYAAIQITDDCFCRQLPKCVPTQRVHSTSLCIQTRTSPFNKWFHKQNTHITHQNNPTFSKSNQTCLFLRYVVWNNIFFTAIFDWVSTWKFDGNWFVYATFQTSLTSHRYLIESLHRSLMVIVLCMPHSKLVSLHTDIWLSLYIEVWRWLFCVCHIPN